MPITYHARDVSAQCADVITWRRRHLTAVGFDPVAAEKLATDFRWDLHAILQLVERGCPPSLALRIQCPAEQLEAYR